MLNLQIHSRQRFMNVLHMLDRHLDQLATMPDDCAYGAYVGIGPKGRAQQPNGVQV